MIETVGLISTKPHLRNYKGKKKAKRQKKKEFKK